MIIVEYAAFKNIDQTVWSAMTFGMKFHHAPSKSCEKQRDARGNKYEKTGEPHQAKVKAEAAGRAEQTKVRARIRINRDQRTSIQKGSSHKNNFLPVGSELQQEERDKSQLRVARKMHRPVVLFGVDYTGAV